MPNDKPTRRPKPYAPPLTLAELVLDLDQRMEVLHGADALTDVELPAEDWTKLVEAAEEEQADHVAFASEPHDDLKADLAYAVGWGQLNSSEELLQVVRGYMMALDFERQRAIDRVDELLTRRGQPTGTRAPPAAKTMATSQRSAPSRLRPKRRQSRRSRGRRWSRRRTTSGGSAP